MRKIPYSSFFRARMQICRFKVPTTLHPGSPYVRIIPSGMKWASSALEGDPTWACGSAGQKRFCETKPILASVPISWTVARRIFESDEPQLGGRDGRRDRRHASSETRLQNEANSEAERTLERPRRGIPPRSGGTRDKANEVAAGAADGAPPRGSVGTSDIAIRHSSFGH